MTTATAILKVIGMVILALVCPGYITMELVCGPDVDDLADDQE